MRTESFAQSYAPSLADRLGVWMSARKINSLFGDLTGKDFADFGCGFQAQSARALLGRTRSVTLVDVALAPDLKSDSRIRAVEGAMPDCLGALRDGSLDALVCNNVLEHLWRPQATLREFHRALRVGGCAFINVPSWAGKAALEFAAFKLNVSPRSEMNDHKIYYDPRELWPLMVRAGFMPENIQVATHKFGLNTYAFCRKSAEDSPGPVTD